MRKTIGLMILLVSSKLFALAPECQTTWNNSSAALSCGYVCTNPDSSNIPFDSTYDPVSNQCTFKGGCCQGMPYQSCTYQYAVCDHANITVKKDDSKFHNDHGKLVHD